MCLINDGCLRELESSVKNWFEESQSFRFYLRGLKQSRRIALRKSLQSKAIVPQT